MISFLVKLTNKSKNIFFIIILLIINLFINKTLFAYNNNNNNSSRITNNSKNKISNKTSNNKTCDKTKTGDLNIKSNIKSNIKFDPKIKCPKDVLKLTKLHLMGGQYLQKKPTHDDLKEINKIAKFAILNNKIFSNNINKNKNNTIYYGCVTTQVVAGINYRFTVLYDKNYYRATVWKQLDNKCQLTELKKIQY